MLGVESILTDNLDIWTSAIERKSAAGRGRSKKFSLYGIEKLRSLILDLAVRGKLVPQDPNDEPASKLLKRIEFERRQLVSSGTAKRAKPVVVPADWPFSIPNTWVWTQIGIITNYGETDKANPGEVESSDWVLELEDIEKGSSRLIEKVRYCDRPFQSPKNRFFPGDVIYGKLRPYLDKVIIADEAGVCTTEMVPFRGYADLDHGYLRLFIKTPFFIDFASNSTHGMNLPRLGTEKARGAPISLPPLAEQHRIVTKVDELMTLCDVLEAGSYDAIETHQLLVQELLSTLTNSTEAADLTANWARIETHFDTLFTTENSIDRLKQTILQLAVTGKLVPQDPNDEPASDLLMRIKGDKAKRVANGNSKKSRYSRMDESSGVTFEIPKNWCWTTFAELATKITDGAHHTPTYVASGVPFLSVKDMSSGNIDLSDTRFISEEEHKKLFSRCNPEKGDLLITKVGTTGIPVIVEIDQPFSLFVSVALIKAPWNFLSVAYLKYLVSSPFVKEQSALGTQGIGNKNLVLKTIASFTLPLPPLTEQNRIVSKVDELMLVCEALKTRLIQANNDQKRFVDAIAAKAVA